MKNALFGPSVLNIFALCLMLLTGALPAWAEPPPPSEDAISCNTLLAPSNDPRSSSVPIAQMNDKLAVHFDGRNLKVYDIEMNLLDQFELASNLVVEGVEISKDSRFISVLGLAEIQVYEVGVPNPVAFRKNGLRGVDYQSFYDPSSQQLVLMTESYLVAYDLARRKNIMFLPGRQLPAPQGLIHLIYVETESGEGEFLFERIAEGSKKEIGRMGTLDREPRWQEEKALFDEFGIGDDLLFRLSRGPLLALKELITQDQ